MLQLQEKYSASVHRFLSLERGEDLLGWTNVREPVRAILQGVALAGCAPEPARNSESSASKLESLFVVAGGRMILSPPVGRPAHTFVPEVIFLPH